MITESTLDLAFMTNFHFSRTYELQELKVLNGAHKQNPQKVLESRVHVLKFVKKRGLM